MERPRARAISSACGWWDKRGWSETLYEGHGDPIESKVYLQGAQPLVRDAAGAPIPATPANDTWITTSKTRYDAFGNSVFTWAPGDRCALVEYDDHHTQLPIREHVYVGGEGTVTVENETFDCGARDLQAEADYDYALQAVVKVTDVNAGVTEVEYDTFGRMKAMYAPNPNEPFEAGEVPSLMVAYHLGTPVSVLVSKTQDGADHEAAAYHASYAYVDGLGRTIATLSEADVADDGFAWVVEGLTDYDQKGAERRKYLAWTYDGDPTTYNLAVSSPSKYGQQRYDAFGRAVETQGLDGTVTLMTRYHALSADAWDAEDIGPGPHQGTYASEEKDGHGRVTRTTERVHVLGDIEARQVEMTYLPTGEPLSITRRRGSDSYTRTMQYDSLGRMTVNLEPTGGVNGWRYLYDHAGDLVATSDPRGCGVNFAYDRGGRLLSEDYSPCESYQDVYSATAEVVYEYDDWVEPTAFSDANAPSFVPGQDCRLTNYTLGRLVAVTDRAQRSITCYDGRGRTVEVAKQLKDPSGNLTARWYNRRAKYDGADRPVVESTGAQLLVGGQVSQIETSYTDRGKVDQVSSSYGLLVDHVTRDADGLVKEIQYGDGAATTTAFTYDDLRRLRNLTTYRASQTGWTNGEHTQQMLLQDEQFTYDRVGNPVEVRDWRDPEEWPAGAKPVTRKLQYDDLYRLSRIDYQQVGGEDAWTDPYAAEVLDNERPQPSPRADFSSGGKRVQWQTYAYDWLGNTTSTDDDQHAFYDRSLGTVGNGTTKRYQLDGANNNGSSGTRNGSLSATYDAAGNLVSMDVSRDGACTVPGGCANQRYEYEWDEVGRLTRSRRWNMQNPGTVPPDAELTYTYDASDQRVRKTSGSRHTLYVFGSLELRQAAFTTDYELSESTEVPYLFANGVRLGRVVHVQEPIDGVYTRVFLELGDHLGSTSVVLDRASGELVQRSTAYAYGEVETSLRPGRWEEFREDYRFTGKEDDVEVGLIYFGKRFYAPLLGRWISPDPLAIHAPGEADLNLYAYVHGKVLVAVDPVGLEKAENLISGDLKTAVEQAGLDPSRSSQPLYGDVQGPDGRHYSASPETVVGLSYGLEHGGAPTVTKPAPEATSRGGEIRAPTMTSGQAPGAKRVAFGGGGEQNAGAGFFELLTQAVEYLTDALDSKRPLQADPKLHAAGVGLAALGQELIAAKGKKCSGRGTKSTGGGGGSANKPTSSGPTNSGRGTTPIQRVDPQTPRSVYNGLRNVPSYPQNFAPARNGTTRNPVKNRQLLDRLRVIEPGDWKKVYKDGTVGGERVSLHYFQSPSGKVFDFAMKPGWSNK